MITAIIPYTLKGWFERQDRLTVTMFSSNDTESWIVKPPYEIWSKDHFASTLYSGLLHFREGRTIRNVSKNAINIILRHPYPSESTDYESVHDKEPETSILSPRHIEGYFDYIKDSTYD